MSRKVHLNIAIPVSMKEEIRELCVKYKDTENDVRTLTDIFDYLPGTWNGTT
jgi:hypothetical protein